MQIALKKRWQYLLTPIKPLKNVNTARPENPNLNVSNRKTNLNVASKTTRPQPSERAGRLWNMGRRKRKRARGGWSEGPKIWTESPQVAPLRLPLSLPDNFTPGLTKASLRAASIQGRVTSLSTRLGALFCSVFVCHWVYSVVRGWRCYLWCDGVARFDFVSVVSCVCRL